MIDYSRLTLMIDNQESLDFTDSKNKKCIQCFTVQENRLIQNKQARMDPQ